MGINDIISAIGTLLKIIGKNNKPKIIIKVLPINVVDDNSWELDVTQTMETGNIEKVYVPRRIDIEISVINEGPGSIYVEELRFILKSNMPVDFSNAFTFRPIYFGLPDPLEIKERRKAVFKIDREKLKEEALSNELGEIIEHIWVKDSTDNYTKYKVPSGMKRAFDFRKQKKQ